MPKVRRNFLVLTTALLLLRFAPAVTAAGGDPAEYMIYQYPDVALVVKVDVPEAEFSMRVLDPDDAVLAEATVPGRRLGPVFQYLPPPDIPRQLMVEVTPARPLARSAIDMQLIQLEAGNPNTRYLAQAYQLFSTGTAVERGRDTNTWVVKTYSLRNAAAEFAALGMEEMRLWSEYLAAHLVLYRLGDGLTAMELARDIEQAAARAGLDQVELAALALEGEALGRQVSEGGIAARDTYGDRARLVFNEVNERAGQRGLAVIQGRALFLAGQLLELQNEPDQALEKYREALAASGEAGDADLLTQVRNASASLQESLGMTGEAIATLDQLAAGLEGGEDEGVTALDLAEGLFEKGRLLNTNYRYAEAAGELARALDLQRGSSGSEPWGPTGLELAWSLFSLGELDRSAELIQESLPRTPLQGHRELLARAYDSLARIRLIEGEFTQAEDARRRQGEVIGEGPGRAAYLFASAMDARARFGPGSAEAERLLRLARQAASAAADSLADQRAQLQLCLSAAEQGRADTCSGSEVDRLSGALRDAGVPGLAAEAALARARILQRRGDFTAAWREADALVEDLHWFQLAVPGVLGAWYAQHGVDLNRDYLDLAVKAGRSSPEGSRGRLPLLALERIRALRAAEIGAMPASLLDAETDERLRSLLARREAAARSGSARLSGEVRQALADARRGCNPCREPRRRLMSLELLDELIDSLSASEAVLAYDFSGPDGRVLLATDSEVRVDGLARAAELSKDMAAVRSELARGAGTELLPRLASLGERLLGPLSGRLPRRIYLLPLGPLRGLPIDALPWQGRVLADRHEVVLLAGLPALSRREPVMAPDYRNRVFLAGDPRRERDPFSLEVVISPEVAAVTDAFVGPGLHIVQGLALQKDEFQDERFSNAALVHLAAPGRLDLADPDASYLTLSRGNRLEDGNMLAPAEVRSFEVAASLVVLSRTVMVGEGHSALGGRVAIVSDFLDAGARSVIFTLWPLGEAESAAFAADFYRNLGRDPDIARALEATRRSRMGGDPLQNFQQWAGFQLFIR